MKFLHLLQRTTSSETMDVRLFLDITPPRHVREETVWQREPVFAIAATSVDRLRSCRIT